MDTKIQSNFNDSQRKYWNQNQLLSLTFYLLFLFQTTTIQGQVAELDWVIGNNGVDGISSVAVDDTGNVYTVGEFSNTVDFDPGPGVYNLSAGSADATFIQKSDNAGNFIWAKSIQANSIGSSVVCLDNLGNVYITGNFNQTADFDPGPTVYNLTSFGNTDFFILKLDNAGNFIWAKNMGGTNVDYSIGMTVDAIGNTYTTGAFSGTADFDPSLNTFNLTSVAFDRNVFVLKLNPTGDFVWAKSMGGWEYADGNSIVLDGSGHVYTTGHFRVTADFDPGPNTFNLTAAGQSDMFIQKLDTAGNFIWAKSVGSVGQDEGEGLTLDNLGHLYITGLFAGTVDFDPNVGVENLTAIGNHDMFVQKLDTAGNFIWAKHAGDVSRSNYGFSITTDDANDIYTTGYMSGTVDFDPNIGTSFITESGGRDIFIQKLDTGGNLLWAKHMGAVHQDIGYSITVDHHKNVFTVGIYKRTVDFDPGIGIYNLPAVGSFNNGFVQKLKQRGIYGNVYLDFNQNCIQENNESGLADRILTINPGNIYVSTNSAGLWIIDSLPVGNYTITADTSSDWTYTCPITQSFIITNPDSIIRVPSFGAISTSPCSAPNVSIYAPFLRPGFSNQTVYIEACNHGLGNSIIDSAYLIIELDSLLTVQSSSLPYTYLGNHQYEVPINDLYPGHCTPLSFSCSLSTNAINGQSLCMSATLYPIDTCSLDTIPSPYGGGVSPCSSSWDKSTLSITAACINDSIQFIIYNTGELINGDMDCFAPVRLYIDGQFMLFDSIQLAGGDSITYLFSGDGRTWRLEVDQHPLHPGSSNPSVTIEICGDRTNWTQDLVNILPHNDTDPMTDIYCGLVTGSYDPNDKTGYPLGLGATHDIAPQQQLEYLINFQNTGTDTAFSVVIRDTLSTDLDIYTFRPGVSSHDYTFRIYGQRILEWTFQDILLADSTINEPLSHGFLKFTVDQDPALPLGTIIENSAAIYFDYNLPIITNTTHHRLATPALSIDGQDSLNISVCDSLILNGIVYSNTGTYYNYVQNAGIDSLYIINLELLRTDSLLQVITCDSFILNTQTYLSSGVYTQTISNVQGCDSLLTLDLTIQTTSSQVTEISCDSFIAPDGNVYQSSGQYVAVIPNTIGCDSVITVDLTVKNSSFVSITEISCDSFIAPDGLVYQTSGQYTATLPNTIGCDSIISIDLMVKNSSFASMTEISCDSFLAPDGNTYFSSGQYTAVIPNTAGCDSTITIDLTTVISNPIVMNITACDSFVAPDGNTYFSSGQYVAILDSINCDSTYIINLTINSININVSISQVGTLLLAGASGNSTFQWLSCDSAYAPIPGAVNALFQTNGIGSYALQISEGGCVDTSLCYPFVTTGNITTDLNSDTDLLLAPNPTTGIVHLIQEKQEAIRIEVIDNLGQIILTKSSTKHNTKIDLSNFSAGVYYLSIQKAGQIRVEKVIKQ